MGELFAGSAERKSDKNKLTKKQTLNTQLKLTSQKGKVLIKAKRIFAVSLIILRSDLSFGHLRRDLSSGQ
jgi:hypothetical protein